MMLIVCSYHALVYCDHNVMWLNHALLVGVVGFVVISGWFGVKFSWRKVFHLYGVAAYGAFVSGLLASFIGDVHGVREYVFLMLNTFREYWFVHAYVIMMIFTNCLPSPPSPPVCMHTHTKGMFLHIFHHVNANTWAILGLVFVWSFLGEVWYSKWLVPKSAGLTQMSGYTLIGIYLAARLLRTYESLLPKNAIIWLLCALGFGGAVSCLHFGFYNSPFQLISAMAWFLAFKGLKLNKGYRKYILSVVAICFLDLCHSHDSDRCSLYKVF